MKLYAEEDGTEDVTALEPLVVSLLSRVEVTAAIWRKQRLGELDAEEASVLTAAFLDDWDDGRFVPVELAPAQLDLAVLQVPRHDLRAGDAVQLACALAARDADASCRRFACFDRRLRAAAAAEGFALLPTR